MTADISPNWPESASCNECLVLLFPFVLLLFGFLLWLPQLDYADVVWDNCTQKLSEDLENLHLDAIRTITGAVRGTNHQKLYTESGFTTLRERRLRHKIIMYHKIVHEKTPTYLNVNIPPLVSSFNPYHRRRPLQRQEPQHKTETYRQSFFPSTTTLWNNLLVCIQRTKSMSQVKHFLSRNDTNVPTYIYKGSRQAQMSLQTPPWHKRFKI